MANTRAILTTSLGMGAGVLYFLRARRAAHRRAGFRGKIAKAAGQGWRAMREAGHGIAERAERTSGFVARRLAS